MTNLLQFKEIKQHQEDQLTLAKILNSNNNKDIINKWTLNNNNNNNSNSNNNNKNKFKCNSHNKWINNNNKWWIPANKCVKVSNSKTNNKCRRVSLEKPWKTQITHKNTKKILLILKSVKDLEEFTVHKILANKI